MNGFLADENCDADLVRALRGAGYDVFSIAEALPGAKDSEIFALSIEQRRILVSQDQDFSRLSAKSAALPPGILMLRWGRCPKELRAQRLLTLLARRLTQIEGHIVVVEPAQERFRPLRPIKDEGG